MAYTLAFDIYGTIINTSGVYNTLKKIVPNQTTIFMNTWRNKQLEYSFRRGLMNRYVDFSICTKEALDYSCDSLGVDLNIEQRETLMNSYKMLPAFDDVKRSLEELKAKDHRIFAFSNGSEKAIIQLLENAAIINLFDGIVSVESQKTFKPNPKVYAYFNTASQSSKSDSWLISGNSFDVIGAASYGMNTAWVQRSVTDVFDAWEYQPSVTINSLSELASKLDI